jgi:hypothetical protein
MTSLTDKVTIQKLKGTSNYEVWSLRSDAFLIKEGQKRAIIASVPEIEQDINDKALANIKLLVEDGPLLQIQHITSAKEAWEALKNLYSPKGFTSEFLICREFFNTTLDKYTSMEEYLNKVKQLSDQLKSKQLELPKQVVIAWVLNSLTDNYEGFVSNVTQSLRNNAESFTIETLFSNLLDESKRQDNKDYNSNTQILFAKYKGKKPYKIVKGKYCKHCKLASHDIKDCYFLFPNKAPKSWNKRFNNILNDNNNYNSKEGHPRDIRDENIDVLYTKTPNSSKTPERGLDEHNLDFENIEDFNFEDIQVFNTTTLNNNNNITNSSLDKLIPIFEDLTSKKASIEQIKVFNIQTHNNYTANFILDCAATRHIITNKEYFYSFDQCDKRVNWGNARSINIKGTGNVYIYFIDTKLKCVLKNCLYMPELGINLISQGELNKETATLLTYKHIILKQGNKLITKGEKIQNLYYLPITVLSSKENILYSNTNSNTTNKLNTNNKLLWHQRLGHIHYNNLNKLEESTVGFNNSNNTNNTNIDYSINNCEVCLRAKFTNKVNYNTNDNNTKLEYLDKVASDLCGPINPRTYDNYRYFITFLDKATRYLEVQLLRTKDEAYSAFSEFKLKAENNKHNYKIRVYATDNGREFINKRFKDLITTSGIRHQLSPPYTHEPNGFIERINRTIINKTRSLLYNSNLPLYMWGEAVLAATYLYNRTPHTSINYKTPFELKYNTKPDISNIRVWGSIAYYKNKGNNIKKLDPRANKGLLIGYGQNQYRIWDIELKRPIWSRDVKILENNFINSNKNTNNTSHNTSNINSIEVELNTTSNNTNNQINQIDQIDLISYNNNNTSNNIINTTPSTITIDNDNNDDNNSLDELALVLLNNINNEPKTYKQALESLNKQEWLNAMNTEITELEAQNTWTIINLPPNKIPLRGKWVYKLKTDNKGNIKKYKARWVIKGFNQILGIDYIDTFSTTCRPETYRLVFIIAITNNWKLNQYDVKNAFVHALIDVEIYTELPTGYYTNTPNKVCKLNKALYGLKQSPRLWYKHLYNILNKLGFTIFPHDEAVFIHIEYKIIIICHVDDFITTGPNDNLIALIIKEVNKEIKLQYLGELNQFLGMDFIINNNKELYINQDKYTQDIINKYNKQDLTPISTPINLGVQLIKSSTNATKEDIKLYQQQIGALLYLALKTRPDITYAVNKCSRFMSNPDKSHFKALDQIWKYLNKYPKLGLYYNCNNPTNTLKGYSDSDWGGDISSRKSTSGFLFLYNNNIISWNSTLQKTVALSSCEAEYMALKEATKESIYLTSVITYINTKLQLYNTSNIPTILVDNKGSLKLAENPEFHKRTKHIDIIYHFIRECIRDNKLKVGYIPTLEQLADGFTKGLDNNKQQNLINNLNINKNITL